MVDTLPTFDERDGETVADADGPQGTDSAAQSGGDGGSSAGETSGGDQNGNATAGNDAPGASGVPGMPTTGTRAEGGLEPAVDGWGDMTAAEQVAVLDRQLEASTGDFDALILEQQAAQRARDRERSREAAAQSAGGAAGEPAVARNPYEDGIAGNSTGGGMGGIARAGNAPANPAVYAPPKDIPEGDDDDVVARQLREAAMREPDPEVRDKLWNEYRRYKGIDIPEAN